MGSYGQRTAQRQRRSVSGPCRRGLSGLKSRCGGASELLDELSAVLIGIEENPVDGSCVGVVPESTVVSLGGGRGAALSEEEAADYGGEAWAWA